MKQINADGKACADLQIPEEGICILAGLSARGAAP